MGNAMSAVRVNLYDLTREELRRLFVRWDLSPLHAERVWNYLYLQRVVTLAEMPELPPKLRKKLEAETALGVLPTSLETDSSDGFTRKYLLGLADGERIETVLMRFTGRVTACVSSQVGCAMGCVFCATGQMGYTRHLTPGEIVAQAVHVARALRTPSVAGL
jgi:23S rRNA (adenine2503-C2)-methyltransferase